MEHRQAAALPFVERRAFEPVRVDCPARLITAGSYLSAQLCDLSQRGARLLLDNAPAEGTQALLQWDVHESLCTIIWASETACGVAFETRIYSNQAAGSDRPSLNHENRPVAAVTKIEFGTKRFGLASSRAEPCEEEASELTCWSIALSRQPSVAPFPTAGMSAAEEMFFLGSPLAHVVQYEAGRR
jgi:hypothetical protein